MIRVKIPMSDQGGKEGFGMTRKRTLPTKPHHMGGIKKTKRNLAQAMENVSSVKLPTCTTTQDEPLKDLTLTVIVPNNSPVLSLTQDLQVSEDEIPLSQDESDAQTDAGTERTN